MVGGAEPAPDAIGRSVVVIVGSHGNSCTGVALARDLVLTAAHCVLPGADYKIVEFDAARRPLLRDIASIRAHPTFDPKKHRAGADVALLKLSVPLARVVPATLAPPASRSRRATRSLLPAPESRSMATANPADRADRDTRGDGKPGTLQIRLFDPATKGESTGLGAAMEIPAHRSFASHQTRSSSVS